MLKKTFCLFISLILVVSCFASCADTLPEDNGKLSVVCTVFPQYDWVRNILGEKAADTELTLLLDSGTDLHSYQPTAADIIKVTSSDLFIYVGGNSDKWVEDVFATSPSETVKLDLMDVLGTGVFEEEVVEGMEAEEEEEEAGEGPEYDEHVWLSLKNAEKLCQAITDALSQADPDNKAVYEANLAAYTEELKALDGDYAAAAAAAGKHTVLFADRFPFRYLTEDYGLDYHAAFTGCSAETEAAFETVSFLASKTDELGLSCVLVTETSDRSIAETVIKTCAEAAPAILVMDAMQSVTADKVSEGKTYIETMRQNLEVLKQALQ